MRIRNKELRVRRKRKEEKQRQARREGTNRSRR